MSGSSQGIHDVIIVGTGPAGLTAALYTARAGMRPIIFEGHEPGGQLTLTTEVDNFPGFPNGILGPELISNIKKQAARFGAEYVSLNIEEVDLKQRPFRIRDSKGQWHKSQTLIISTGASAKFLGLPGEKELTGKGVSTCATCDGFFYRDKIVHVVGGGDTAIEESSFLTKFAKKVYLVHRRDKLRASLPMQERAQKNEKIEIIWNTDVLELLKDAQGLTGIKVKNNVTGEVSERKTDGLFYGIGHSPNTQFLGGQIELDSHGFIKTKNGPLTNIEGVFACGDVQDSYYRQAITAAGSGCQAALRAERFLEAKGRV